MNTRNVTYLPHADETDRYLNNTVLAIIWALMEQLLDRFTKDQIKSVVDDLRKKNKDIFTDQVYDDILILRYDYFTENLKTEMYGHTGEFQIYKDLW